MNPTLTGYVYHWFRFHYYRAAVHHLMATDVLHNDLPKLTFRMNQSALYLGKAKDNLPDLMHSALEGAVVLVTCIMGGYIGFVLASLYFRI